MWITDTQNTLFVCILSNKSTKQQQCVLTVTLSRGSAPLLQFKDQEATAGGLWCPRFLRPHDAAGRSNHQNEERLKHTA